MDDRTITSGMFLLAVILITLKIAGVISWPWLAVLAPIWVPAMFTLILFFFVIIGIAIYALMRKLNRRKG